MNLRLPEGGGKSRAAISGAKGTSDNDKRHFCAVQQEVPDFFPNDWRGNLMEPEE